MRVTVHVRTVEEVPEARQKAEASMIEGDELEIIVGGISQPAERQAARPAGGVAANMGGA